MSTPPATSYSRICLLSKGGMGEVEVALRRGGSFERLYALKRLHPQYRDEPEFLEMFKQEARIAGLVRHVNVVSELDVGEDEKGPFLVMEYVEGMPLSRLLQLVEPRLPIQVALRIVRNIARGLQAAHELTDHEGTPVKIVHRDVSPQNVLVGFDGSVRVTDFGIAKALDGFSKTSTGVLKGKMGYLSPEQLRFEEADQRADLFSLGVVLFEAMTGTRLYRGDRAPWRILNEPAPDPRERNPKIPSTIARLTCALLSKTPGNRPDNAKSVVRTLDLAIAQLSVESGLQSVEDFVRVELADARTQHKEWLSTQVLGYQDRLDLKWPTGAAMEWLGTGDDTSPKDASGSAGSPPRQVRVPEATFIVSAQTAIVKPEPTPGPAESLSTPSMPLSTPLSTRRSPARGTGIPPMAWAITLLVAVALLALVFVFQVGNIGEPTVIPLPSAEADPSLPTATPTATPTTIPTPIPTATPTAHTEIAPALPEPARRDTHEPQPGDTVPTDQPNEPTTREPTTRRARTMRRRRLQGATMTAPIRTLDWDEN